MKDPKLKASPKDIKKFLRAIEKRSEKTASIVGSSLQEFFQAIPIREKFRTEYGFVPYNLTISPTYWCNLKCVDCYSESSKDQSEVLSSETIDKAIEEGSEKWKIPFFSISGGESLYHALEIAKTHPKKIFQLYTNGTLITEQISEELAEIGNLIPLVSIEGSKEETDRIRGQGIYNKIINIMDMLTKRGVIWGVSFTLTSNNSDVYDKGFLDFLISKGALLGRFVTYIPIGREADLKKVPSTGQRKKQGDALRRIDEKGIPFYSMDYMNNPRFVEGCAAAGLRYVHIDPLGDVYPCVFIPAHAEFNLSDTYNGKHVNEGITCLEDILTKDKLMRCIRESASKADTYSCCLVIDNPKELKKIVPSCI